MADQVHTAAELATVVAKNPDLQAKMKDDPVGTINELAAPIQSDKWIYRLVVSFLGLIAFTGLIGLIVLVALGKPTGLEGVVAIASAAVGALGGLLAPSPSTK